ncbi:hypothetical protein GFO_0326 [Christiangramia forsetii KT0803]|uniref:Uncharacterized protein n=1 Tax=Christiangramia forsetii (strain DSM 17595 / CGMCC 1.15422 / KT0803) TaxID=411154 RepID=A0LY67_CHRFK|nr:hypothetical protein GFO_0326 [Christiangramia forsetii KT0803]
MKYLKGLFFIYRHPELVSGSQKVEELKIDPDLSTALKVTA